MYETITGDPHKLLFKGIGSLGCAFLGEIPTGLLEGSHFFKRNWGRIRPDLAVSATPTSRDSDDERFV